MKVNVSIAKVCLCSMAVTAGMTASVCSGKDNWSKLTAGMESVVKENPFYKDMERIEKAFKDKEQFYDMLDIQIAGASYSDEMR